MDDKSRHEMRDKSRRDDCEINRDGSSVIFANECQLDGYKLRPRQAAKKRKKDNENDQTK